MGIPKEDFVYVVEDVLEETQEEQPEFADMLAPIDKEGSLIMLNQNSREPVLGTGRNGAAVEDPPHGRRGLDVFEPLLGR